MSSSSRRDFLRTSAAATAASLFLGQQRSALGASALRDGGKTQKPQKLLVFGGTGLIGPALVSAAIERGHTVTLFNRGKHGTDLFPGVEKLIGDHDPKKGEGLKALEGRKFDVVFDDVGYYPRVVKASAELLAPNSSQYIYVSSISAYKDGAPENSDENATLATMADPTVEDMGKSFENYGPLKVLCEKAVQAAYPDKATIVRPGYIVGPNDSTHRFTWWPLRVRKGGEVLVPGGPDDPIQIIDCRDLGEWMLKLAENHTMGVFNACGPAKKLSMREVLETSKAATGSDAKFTYVSTDFLKGEKVDLDSTWPIWSPYEGETKGFHTWKNERAMKTGLTFRTLRDTIDATLAWYDKLPAEKQTADKGRIPADREAELLAKWHAKS